MGPAPGAEEVLAAVTAYCAAEADRCTPTPAQVRTALEGLCADRPASCGLLAQRPSSEDAAGVQPPG